jgi:UDPglucose 6-dehydrogenase
MKIIIAGYGFVGKAVVGALEIKHDIVIVDPKYTENKITDHQDAEGIIICVNTPYIEKGGCDASIICEVLDQVPIHIPVLIKSTVTPAVVDALETMYKDHWIVYSPEFLRARSASQDFLNQKHIIIGGDDTDCYWQGILQGSLPNCNLVLNCSAKEASIIKYASNSFLALKTSYFNQLFDICLNTGMDFDTVRHVLAQDPRIGSDHTMVPGPDGERGWGGHCFPKDTNSFVQWARSVNSPISTLEMAIEYNNSLRKTLDKS